MHPVDDSSRAQAHGHALIRLLANISGADAPAPSQSLSDRLGQWIDWRHAVALSAALDARPAAPADAVSGDDGECARVRAALISAIEGDRAFSAVAVPSAGADDAEAASAEVAFYRQRYLTLQQVMEGEIGRLRGRLRNRLAKQGGPVGRLAAIDAVMEQAVGAHERSLLAPLPEQVAGHFERLRQAGAKGASKPSDGPAPWLDRFRTDMQRLLLAELDIRLQPSLGLLAALRTKPSEAHAP